MNSKRDAHLLKELKEFMGLLDQAIIGLEDVRQHCSETTIEDQDDDPRALERFDALAIRFARVSDIFTQKILRTIFMLLREVEPTFIDRAKRAEKLDLITSEDELIFLRDLRNGIVHEYEPEDWMEIFRQIYENTPLLLENIEKTKLFAREKFSD